MLQPQAFIAFVLQYWAYILIAGFAAAVAGLWRRLADSERRAAAEKEQTFFLSILYIIMRSGKTLMHALAEAAGKKEIVERLSREAAYLRREGERTTLAEAFRRYVHPSREFSLLVGSIGEDLESGFGVVEKLEKFLEQATARETERWSRYVGTVETLGEAVVSVILLVPLLYVVGTILGGFPVIYIAVIILLAASVFYVVSAASEPMHLVDLPRHITLGSLAVILVSGGLVGVLFLGPMFFPLAAVAGLLLLGWGLFVHFVYVSRAVAEGEAAFLLLDGVGARLRAGYPIGRSLEGVVDPRYARYAKAVSRGLELRPLNRFMRLSIETVKLARLGGLGAEAIGLMSRLAIAIYLSFTNARARMKLYDALSHRKRGSHSSRLILRHTALHNPAARSSGRSPTPPHNTITRHSPAKRSTRSIRPRHSSRKNRRPDSSSNMESWGGLIGNIARIRGSLILIITPIC
jgi:hypothetical protein